MMKIHKSAIVGKKAKIGKDVEIGPWCVIEDGAVIGDNTKIWHNVYIASGTVIGKDNVIHMGAVLGHEPQHTHYKGEKTGLVIGDGNVIREYVTMHRSFVKGGQTVTGDNNYFMAASHIAHDCKVGNGVIMVNGALLGGHVTVEDNVFMGGGAAAHQFTRIGTLAMIGGLTRVTQDVVPYTLLECDALVRGLNIIGLKRSNIGEGARRQIKAAYKLIYESGLNTSSALQKIKAMPRLAPEVAHIVEFIESSKRGICKHR